ncbi:MAG: hypothetical protein KC420_21815, partial [Myxococcales bacterium]|nr:hypothetical protein [Myxococcales bacterium]
MQPEAKPRPELVEHLDTWLDELTRPCGYLVLSTPPTVDLASTLDHWCAILEEDAEIIVRLRVSGDDGEDRPEALRERLAAAIEGRFPDFRDPLAHPGHRLADLLRRLGNEHLAPPSRRLLLVIEGLGELRERDGDDDPLPRLL